MVALVTQAALAPGTQIAGRYTIESVLGEGGMGTVFAATQAFTQRKVAIKVLHASWAKNETAVQRFIQEARVLATLSHPNIAQIVDGGVDPECGVFVAMERLEGQTLQQYLAANGTLDVRLVDQWLVPVMNALAVAHDAQVLHRDVKPDNIFLARQADGTIVSKLLDFGMSKLGTSPSLIRTKTGSMVGTPSYMSPEQTRGEKDIDGRSDVWSMGVVLYQCLCGALPFEGANIPAVIAGVLMNTPQPLSERRASIPAPLSDLVMRALEKSPNDRVPSMRALAEALTRIARTSQNPVAFDATIPASASVSQQIRAAYAAASQPITPSISPSQSEVASVGEGVAPSTIAIPAVIRKKVLAEAGVADETAAKERTAQPAAKEPIAPSAIAPEASEPARNVTSKPLPPVLIVAGVATIVCVIVIVMLRLLR
jgi:serine/threonine-protein kinase